MRTRNFVATWLTAAGLLSLGGLLAPRPAHAVTYYQNRLAFDYDALAYDANPADATWDSDDWWQSADLIPGNKGTPTNGPEVQITVNDTVNKLTNIPFTIGPSTDGFNNAMLVYGQTIPVVPGKYTAVVLLYDQDCGPAQQPVTIHYANGDVSQTLTFEDWCFKKTVTDFYAWPVSHTLKTSGSNSDQCGVKYKYIGLDPTRTLNSITLGQDPSVKKPGDKAPGGEEAVIFAMTLISNDSTLPAYGKITGTVKDTGGAADPNADVFIPENGLKARGDQANGNYSITVPAGTYHLTAIKQGDTAPDVAPVSVTVAAGQDVTENLTLGSPIPGLFGEVKGTVLDQNKKPVAGASVTVVSSTGAPLQSSVTDAMGNFDLANFLPGQVTVDVDDPFADMAVSMPLNLQAGPATSLSITLPLLPFVSLDSTTMSLPKGVTWDLQSVGTGAAMISPTDFSPAMPTYKEDTTWLKGEKVPGDVSMDVGGGNQWFWYRLSGLTLPAALQALQGKNVPLILQGFEIGGSPGIDRNAQDMTFFNGNLIGSQNNQHVYNEPATLRSYVIDPAFVNWTGTNTLALLVYTGGTPAGITGAAPVLVPLRSTQVIVEGNIIDAATGKPATSPINVALTRSGESTPFTTAQGTGSYILSGVPPGRYTVSVPTSATVAQGDGANVAPAGGQLVKADLTVTFPSFFEGTAAGALDDPFTGTTLDKKWTDVDIGMPGATGDASLTTGHLKQDGDGSGFNGSMGDALNYLYQNVSGDFAATVEVLSAPGDPNSGAGLMLRTSTDPGAAYLAAVDGNGMAVSPYRLAAGGFNTGSSAPVTAGTPIWLKIRRVGGEEATYWSADGKTATLITDQNTDIPADALLGAVVTSAADGTLDTGAFASFKVVPLTGTSAPPVLCGDLNGDGKVSVGDATIALRVAVNLTTASATNKAGACGHTINVGFATQILRAAVFGTTISPLLGAAG